MSNSTEFPIGGSGSTLIPRLLCCSIFLTAVVFGQTPSSVSLIVSPNPAALGHPVTLQANVTAGATGKVTFYDGTTVLGVATITGSAAGVTTTMLPAGTRSLRAFYSGDSTYAAIGSASVTAVVNAGASLGFRRPVSYPAGGIPYSVAAADFNGDGKADIALGTSNVVEILLGNGDGTFQNALHVAAGSAPQSVVAVDCNGDGKTDLAVANLSSNNVSILLGNGDGTFQAPGNYGVGNSPMSIVAGDFNRDGIVDLAVANGNGGSISVLIGKGDGTFRAALANTGVTSPVSLAVGDWNGDGKPDVAASGLYGVYLLAGNGDGTFQSAAIISSGYNNGAVMAADFDGDGKADVAVGVNIYTLMIIRGNGDGTFQTPVQYSAVNGLRAIANGDFNGDGKLDLALTPGYSGSYSAAVLLGNGDGTFQAAIPYSSSPYVYGLTVADFNGDGVADLATAQYLSGDSSKTGAGVLLGGAIPDLTIHLDHDGGFTQGQTGALYSITVTSVGDVPPSGAVGVVASLPAGFTATTISGNGWTCLLSTLACTRSDSPSASGAYSPITIRVNVPVTPTGNVTAGATVSGGGDLNPANNAASDTAFVRLLPSVSLSVSPNPAVINRGVTLTVSVTSSGAGKVTFYDGVTVLGVASLSSGQASFVTYALQAGTHSLRALYGGDSTYGPAGSNTVSEIVSQVAANSVLPPLQYAVSSLNTPIATADFNHDGKLDLVTGDGAGVAVLLGNGDGTFRPATVFPVAGGSGGRFVIGDFNRDGNPDLAVGYPGALYILAGNGDGTFQASVKVDGYNSNGGRPAVADFNGDGNLDLAYIGGGSPVVLFGRGDGTFDPPVTIAIGSGSWVFLLSADINGDAKPDLVALNPTYNSVVSVFLGNSDGTFQNPVSSSYSSVIYANSFVAGDFDGDGKLDVAVICGIEMTVLAGNGDGSFQLSGTSSIVGMSGYFSMAADFNGDGKLDIAYSSYASGGFYLQLGKGDGTFQNAAQFSYNNPAEIAAADFDGDGRLDIAAATAGSVNVYLGRQYSGLSVAMTHAGAFTGGMSGTYQIAVSNPGFLSSPAGVTVTITLPSGLAATAISRGIGWTGWTCTLATLSCTAPDALLGGGSYSVISLSVSVSAGAAPSILNPQASVLNGGILNTAADATRIVLPTITSLAVSPNPATLGQTVTLVATVTAGSSGTVEFFDRGVFLGSARLSGSQATWSTRLLPAGLRAVSATYSGDLTHAGSASVASPVTVTAAASSGLSAVTVYPAGAGPLALTAGDFNGDGKTDFATANGTDNTISVFLGNGDGTLRAKVDYPAGAKPSSLAIGDFNNDTKPDLAVTNQNSKTVSILLGNGDGTFQAALNYALQGAPVSVAVADLNSDGNADLVVGTDYGAVGLPGNGDGTFSRGVSLGSYGNVTAGDFNGDGKVDIFASSSGYVLLGNGDGTVDSSSRYWAYSNYPPAVGDLNADGKLDIVGANGYEKSVTVCLGKGDGGSQVCATYPTAAVAQAVAIADVNGDGKLDVVAATSNNITVLLGNGDGSLQAGISYSAGSQPVAIVAGDFNGDGRTDIAFASSQSTLSIALGILTPVLHVVSSHNGSFAPGQSGATYVINVSNLGPGSTAGLVTVTDTLPPSLTATAFSGAGWSCTLATLTCTRSDALAASASYPPLTLTVNVSAGAPSSVVNSIMVTGTSVIGGAATDFTLITSNPAVLTVSSNHSGNFARGQAGAVYTLIVSNLAGAGASVGAVTVTDTLPAGLTLGSMSGAGWSCAANTCTRSDALAGGAAYPSITVTVDVAWDAGTPLMNVVSLSGGGSVTAGATNSTTIVAPQGLRFVPVTPCRMVDTRNPAGPFGGPAMAGGDTRSFLLPNSACGIPSTALAYSLNVAVAPAGPLGYVTLWPKGQAQPVASTLNSLDGRVKSNAAIVPAGLGGGVSVFASNATHLILDINGYFLPATDPTGLAFYPVTPCRIADTRKAVAPLGGPFLAGGQTRSFPVLAAPACNIPASAQAYSLNFAVVPKGPLGYITAWPTGRSQPPVASLNAPTGVVTANAAIVPAGTGGAIDIFASNATDLVIDINGYFAPPGSGGLSLYTVVPCRVLDTRQPSGAAAFSGKLDVNVAGSACGGPGGAQAYVLSATVLPVAALGYLTLWPQGQPQPPVATLNSLDAAVTSNLAIVPANNGSTSAFATNATHLVMDINGVFAP